MILHPDLKIKTVPKQYSSKTIVINNQRNIK